MDSQNTDRIGIQTARMLEIYALLHQELGADALAALGPQTRKQLEAAITTIAGNMRQLQDHLDTQGTEVSSASETEKNSPVGTPDAAPLDSILDAVLKWHQPNEKGE